MKLSHTKPWFAAMACVLFISSGVFGQRVFLVVDRITGEAEAMSSADVPVDAYSITSESGLLNPEGWSSLQDQSVPGWTEANPQNTQLTEVSLADGGLLAGDGVEIGAPYTTGVATLPAQEDLGFQVSVPNADPTMAGSVVTGSVIYTGDLPVPTVTVNRGTGVVELANPGGFEITGFSVGSASGLLNPDGLAEIAGFRKANPTSNLVSAISFEGATTEASLGNVFGTGFLPLAEEDLTLSYTIPGSAEAFEGVVNYTGAVNDFVLKVDRLSGNATIEHMTPHVGDIELTGYSILSASDGLSVANWQKLGGDFAEAAPRAGALAELNSVGGAMTFSNGTAHSLGSIFAGNTQDLVFEYSTTSTQLARGSVQYVFGDAAPPTPTCADVAASRAIAGDLNGDNSVDFQDFLTLSTNFGQPTTLYEDGDIDCGGSVDFPDFLQLSTNFGQTAAAASVPEPASFGLGLFVFSFGLTLRKRR